MLKDRFTKEDLKSASRTCIMMLMTFALGFWFVFATAITVFWLKGAF